MLGRTVTPGRPDVTDRLHPCGHIPYEKVFIFIFLSVAHTLEGDEETNVTAAAAVVTTPTVGVIISATTAAATVVISARLLVLLMWLL